MAEQIKVEHIVANTQALQSLTKQVQGLQKLEQQSKKTGDASNKAAKGAVGSFKQLEKELKDNEAQLKRLKVGSSEFVAQKAKVDRLRQSYNQAKTALKAHNGELRRTSGLGTKIVGSLGAMAGGFFSAHQAAALVTAELENQKRLRLEAATVQRGVDAALIANAANFGKGNLTQVKALVQQNAQLLGTTQAGLTNVLGTAISAGAKDQDEALNVARATLSQTGGDAAEAQTLIGAALDVADFANSDNFRGALGQLSQTASQVRGTNLTEFAKNIAPGLRAATSPGQNTEGLTSEQGLETVAVISQALKDVEGTVTSTALTQFRTRLDAFVPKLVKAGEAQAQFEQRKTGLEDKRDTGELTPERFAEELAAAKEVLASGGNTLSVEQIAEFTKERSIAGRTELLRQNPELAQQFLDRQKEGKGKIAIRALVTGDETTLATEKKAQERITSIDKATVEFEQIATDIKDAAQLLLSERQSQANIEKAQTTGETASLGQIQKQFTDTLRAIDAPGPDPILDFVAQRVFELGLATGASPEQAAQAGLGANMLSMIPDLRSPTGIRTEGAGRLTAEHATLLQEQIAGMNKLAEETRLAREQQAQQANQPIKVQVDNQQANPKRQPPAQAFVP